VTYAPDGRIPGHSLFHAAAWSRLGFKVTLIVVVDEFESFVADTHTDFAAGLCVRLNEGYDFGAWATAIMQMPAVAKANLLVVANDSIYGPFNSFSDLLGRVSRCSADIIGMTESYEINHHIQSYMMFFRQSALRNKAFKKFWRAVKIGGRGFVIRNYELTFMSKMERAGLRTSILFPITTETCNPTLKYWRQLIEHGFPFIKVQLLRDNPTRVGISGWEQLLASHGYDIQLIRNHLRLQ
jgi:lipopolysaccharide biosynthesis protein